MSIKDKIKERYPGFVIWTHKLRGAAAYYLNGMPSKRLRVIGVTGTNGKTTTCYFITKILEEAGERVGMLSTTTFKIGAKEWVNRTNMTTMTPFALQSYLKKMVRSGCSYAVVETSSHSIDQYRNWGVRYYVAAMTNVTQYEHLDYHKKFEDYVKVKTRLFKTRPRVAVVNADDPNADKFLAYSAGQHLTYSQTKKADVVARKILPDRDGTIFTLVLPSVQLTINLSLPGLFNVSNALAAAAVAYGLKVPAEVIKKGLQAVKSVPGRMEKVEEGQDFTVMIDYAVTPDSLEKLYSTLKPGIRGRLIAVLGATGDRDKTKRPILGAIAGRFADVVVVTDEDPYTEDPREIIEQVAVGVPRGDKNMVLGEDYFKIPDRREGIRHALELAKRGDMIVITGMGAQEYRVVGKKHFPWIEKEVIREELKKLGYTKKK